MLRRNECRLNFKNRPVRTGDIKGGVLNNPPATNKGSQEPATNRVNQTGPGPGRTASGGLRGRMQSRDQTNTALVHQLNKHSHHERLDS